jgi:hypothetical protein
VSNSSQMRKPFRTFRLFGTDYLFSYLDYSVYYEGRRHLPQLVVLEAKRYSKKHIMQCEAQMTAFH